MTMGLYADLVELPSAIFKREPYLVALVATGTTGRVEVRSQVFKGIRRKHPLHLNGFELLPVGDTGGFVAARVVVMESDAGFRRLGRLLDKGLSAAKKIPAGRAFVAGFANVAVAGKNVTEVLDEVIGLLKDNKDDEMFVTDVELERRDDRWWFTEGPRPVELGPDGGFSFVRSNKKVRLTLRFATSRAAGLEIGLDEVGFAPSKGWRQIVRGTAVRALHEGRVYAGTYLRRTGTGGLLLARPVDANTIEFGTGGDAIEIRVDRHDEFLVDLTDLEVDYSAFLRTVLGDRPEEIRLGQWAFNTLLIQRPDIAERIRGDVDFDPFADGLNFPEFLGRVAQLWIAGDPDDDELPL